MFLDPLGHHLDVLGHLTHSRPHTALGHSMRAAKVQFNPVCAGILDTFQDIAPRAFFARYHQADDKRVIGVILFNAGDLFDVHLKRAVGDQLDIVQP